MEKLYDCFSYILKMPLDGMRAEGNLVLVMDREQLLGGYFRRMEGRGQLFISCG